MGWAGSVPFHPGLLHTFDLLGLDALYWPVPVQ